MISGDFVFVVDVKKFRAMSGSCDKNISNFKMITMSMRFSLFASIIFISIFGNVSAQAPISFDPPDLKILDDAGVNIISGHPQVRVTPVSIGSKNSTLAYNLEFNGAAATGGLADGFWGDIVPARVWEAYQSTSVNIHVHLFNNSDFFLVGADTDRRQTGAKLIRKADGSYEYISRQGVRYLSDPSVLSGYLDDPTIPASYGTAQVITKVIYPDGREFSIRRTGRPIAPVASVTTNFGYQLRYSYNASSGLERVTAINLAVDYCDPAAENCAYSFAWPFASFAWEGKVVNGNGDAKLTITDSGGKISEYFNESSCGLSCYTRLRKIKWPSSSSAENVSFQYGLFYACVTAGSRDAAWWDCRSLRDNAVKSVDIGNRHWDYSYKQSYQNPPPEAGLDGVWETSATSPSGANTTSHYDIRRNFIISLRGSSGNQSFGAFNRVSSATDAEGRMFSYLYDGRGNLVSKTQTGTGVEASKALVWEANYDVTCGNLVTCNKPNWIKDPKGNKTDYVYDQVHGGILRETSPADVNGIRPQKRYTYVQRTAVVKNNAGGYGSAGSPIWMLDSVSYCRKSNGTSAGCELPNDEVVTRYDYGPTSGPNNLALRGEVVTADGVSRRICYTYDVLGNKTSETTANAGLSSCY